MRTNFQLKTLTGKDHFGCLGLYVITILKRVIDKEDLNLLIRMSWIRIH